MEVRARRGIALGATDFPGEARNNHARRGAEAPPAPLTFGRNTWRGTEIPESDRSLRLRSAQNFFFFKAISVASPGRLQSFEIRQVGGRKILNRQRRFINAAAAKVLP